MLVHLKIKDFAIIDEVELEFQPGFTVVTGETGAGKSILVDALSLVLGGRASSDLVRAGSESAEVEALFDISAQTSLQNRLAQRDLVGDDPNILLIRRVVGVKGRAKVVINGRLSTLAALAEIVKGLVDISGQHEQQSLLVVENHIDILDAFGQHGHLLTKFKSHHDELRKFIKERNALKQNEDEILRRADYLRFQIDEIEKLAPISGEDEQLEIERQKLANADKIRRGISAAENLLYGEDGSAFDKLSRATIEIESLAKLDPELGSLSKLLESSRRETQDVARELQRYLGRIESDPARLDEVDDRLAELKKLSRKHGRPLNGVIERLGELKAEMQLVGNLDSRREELDAAIMQLQISAESAAKELSQARKKAAKQLAAAIASEVAEMSLEGAEFLVKIEPLKTASPMALAGEKFNSRGTDQIEFFWTANPGEPAKPLSRIASGGELSRLMLAVKRVLSSTDLVSLYVFDEVDSGLGGKAADTIGKKIRNVAKDHQAIAITHLAPIAAYAHQHLCVRKESRGSRTVSIISELGFDKRAEEIARMIDGASVSKAAHQTARDMLSRSI